MADQLPKWGGQPAEAGESASPGPPTRHIGAGRWITLILLTACGDFSSDIPAGSSEPVIQMLLVAGALQQVASVEYSAPAESVVAVIARPIAAESVALVLETSDHVPLPLQPVPGVAGRYYVDLTIEPRATYRLMGSVTGRTIEAQVTVPGPVIVDQPAGDTLRLSSGGAQVPYAWHAAGAAAYGVEVSDGARSWNGRVVRDTVGALGISPLVIGRPDTAELLVWAYESAATAFFLAVSEVRPRPGNISGALGGFGAATRADPPKVIIWQ